MANLVTKKNYYRKLLKVVTIKASSTNFVDGENTIDKMLGTKSLVAISETNLVNDFLQIVGRVESNTLFANVEKTLENSTSYTDFNEKIQVPKAEQYFVYPIVKNSKNTKISANSFDLDINIELNIYGVVANELNCMLPNNEGFFEEKKEIQIDALLGCTNDSISLVDTLEINEQLNKILVNEAEVVVNKITPNNSYVVIDGEIKRNIVYTSGEQIRKINKTFDFSEEVSLLNCTPESKINNIVYLKRNNINIKTDENNKTEFEFDSALSVNLVALVEEKFDAVTDIFSETKNLNISTDCTEVYKLIDKKSFVDRLSLVLDTSNHKRIDEVVCAYDSFVAVEQANVENNLLNISGTMQTSLIYKNYDNEEYFSTTMTAPVSFQRGLDPNINVSVEDVFVNVNLVGIKNKAGKELNLSLDADIYYTEHQTNLECYVAGIEETGEKQKDTHSIVVLMPEENKSLFDIAKDLNVAPEIILAQNPGFDGKKTEKVIIYRKL